MAEDDRIYILGKLKQLGDRLDGRMDLLGRSETPQSFDKNPLARTTPSVTNRPYIPADLQITILTPRRFIYPPNFPTTEQMQDKIDALRFKIESIKSSGRHELIEKLENRLDALINKYSTMVVLDIFSRMR